MAAALNFTLFCVLQVMIALSNVLAAPFNQTSGTFSQTPIMDNINPEDQKHGKRSLNLWPFEPKYLSTEHYTLEIKADGTVSASTRSKPPYGVLRILTACLTMTTIPPSFHGNKARKKYGRVSIHGKKADKYLCMNKYGEVYASEKCTDECEFKQEGIKDGGNPHNRYYSLKYRGFLNNPKRSKKKWYLGMKNGQVLKGHSTRKKKPDVLFIQRPVSETSDPLYPPATKPTGIEPTSGVDLNGGVTVVTSPDTSTQVEPRSARIPGPKCNGDDPLNLFRLTDCSKGKRRRGPKRKSGPFSSDRPIRHQRGKSRKSASEAESVDQTRKDFNLFAIPNR